MTTLKEICDHTLKFTPLDMLILKTLIETPPVLRCSFEFGETLTKEREFATLKRISD